MKSWGEKKTNPYVVILLLMCLAECQPLNEPNFLKVASLLTASTSSFLNSLQSELYPHLLKPFSNCQNQLVHLTWPLCNIWHWQPFLSHETIGFSIAFWLSSFLSGCPFSVVLIGYLYLPTPKMLLAPGFNFLDSVYTLYIQSE